MQTAPFPERILLYDFNLQAGDTIPQSDYLTDSQVYTVTSVDEVTLQNGESRKRISFSGGGEESSYIEGLGGIKGLSQPFFDGIGFWNESKCIRQNEISLYGDAFACDWTMSAEEPLKGQSRLYPNPAVAAFTLEIAPQTTFDSNLNFVLHALDGRQVYAASISSAVSEFQPKVASGMYLWQLRRGGDILNTGKVVIE